MSIQWSLVIFTVFVGLSGWLAVCIAINSVVGKNAKRAFAAALAALVSLVVGGIASVTHLAHPERILSALTHPSSGIFLEAVLMGVMGACLIVFLALVTRGTMPSAQKVAAVVSALVGVVLAYTVGNSYVMASVTAWQPIILPLGYLCTAMPLGAAVYLVIVGAVDENSRSTVLLVIAGGLLAAISAIVYGLTTGAPESNTLLLIGGCVVCGGLVPAVCGVLVLRKAEWTRVLGGVALIGALLGSFTFRCVMWLVFDLASTGAPFITNFNAF
jgi:anaerobic dimethyl sulfoxide reductase subunit C (anchor subunit)